MHIIRQRSGYDSHPPVAMGGGPTAGAAVGVKQARRPRRSWLRAKNWDEHVEDLERVASSAGFLDLRNHVLELAHLGAQDRVLDIGAGTGLLALAAAPRVAHVSALDVSPAMCHHLERKFTQLGLENTEALVNGATDLPLADGSLDVVVSNYCFHHLSDRDKIRALAQIARVLRPGGRLVFADMMFRINVISRRDRAVVVHFARCMLRQGPAGLLRLGKNVTRVLTGRGERPAGVQWWRQALLDAGFVEVSVRALAHEGGIASARKPA
jgi:SAM-dependent methyltransferase